jgi:hypothetical protein
MNLKHFEIIRCAVHLSKFIFERQYDEDSLWNSAIILPDLRISFTILSDSSITIEDNSAIVSIKGMYSKTKLPLEFTGKKTLLTGCIEAREIEKIEGNAFHGDFKTSSDFLDKLSGEEEIEIKQFIAFTGFEYLIAEQLGIKISLAVGEPKEIFEAFIHEDYVKLVDKFEELMAMANPTEVTTKVSL